MTVRIICDDEPVRRRIEVELDACGWTVRHDTFLPPVPTTRMAVLSTLVSSDHTASAAMSWNLAGGSLLVQCDPQAEISRRFLDALTHLGPVSDRRGPPGPLDELPTDGLRLLASLRTGTTVTQAAAHAHVSRRSAYRLLEECRRQLRVATVRELTMLAHQHLPPPAPG
jgi:hypothetical protein